MRKKKDYRVIPNLSLRGVEILKRLNNRSLILDRSGGQYSLEEEIDNSRKMNKLDKILRHRELTNNIQQYKNSLQNV